MIATQVIQTYAITRDSRILGPSEASAYVANLTTVGKRLIGYMEEWYGPNWEDLSRRHLTQEDKELIKVAKLAKAVLQ